MTHVLRFLLTVGEIAMSCIAIVAAMFVVTFLLFMLCTYAGQALDFMWGLVR